MLFLSSAIVNALAPSIGKFGSKLGYYGDIAAAALVGGIASNLVGGKFASGAMLGAFAYWFNHKAHEHGGLEAIKRFGKGVKDYFSGFGGSAKTVGRMQLVKYGVGTARLAQDFQDTNELLGFAAENPEAMSNILEYTGGGYEDEAGRLITGGVVSKVSRLGPYGMAVNLTVGYTSLVNYVSNNSWWLMPTIRFYNYTSRYMN